ncbi:Protein VTS1 [Colletotrichum fructicola Nara gc5]|uniref:RNA-binding protein VTS1 n=1 Tax=Colletotrichum fructicola (strain Nara gc5) TaxID=1213859 RepID=A0A7J6JS71_COLFN|nr:Protein VTS1 [Colletotrichum fructicola Nara gc5]
MLNMSGSHNAGNRNSTPEANTTSSLRPPSSRAVPANSHLRASADMAALQNSSPSSRIRPSSDFYGQSQQGQGHGNHETDPQDKIAQQWIADIDQYETTLEEMAAATLDQDFKDELSAIEQWFRVLSEAERTAALYALLQQTTQVQIRFFIQVLQQMDPMTNRLSDAMNKLNVDSARNSMVRPSSTATGKRQSGLDPSTINAMFPDAAAAIATEKAKFTQQTGAPPSSNRNSAVAAPTISAPGDGHDSNGQSQGSPWTGTDQPAQGAKPSGGQPPMGQFQAPPSSGLRSPRPQISGSQNIQNTTLTTSDKPADLPLLSPYNPSGGNWASMVNTPLVANFSAQQSGTQADMVANATAMKLAALSTVNNRFALDDMLALQAQNIGFGQHRSRPSSPGIAMQPGFGGPMAFASPQNNGFLSAYDGSSPLLNNGIPQVNVGQLGVGGHEGYLSDHSDMVRGRSPRGRRGSSKPPEDPTDPTLLQDIPSWLRSLRLHKYTENLKDMKWHELIELDDKALEDRGVNALGARRKMLKVFEQVKDAKADGKLG